MILAEGISRRSGRDDTVFSRQLDIIPQDKLVENAFTVIGAGSLGSCIANTLAMMGAETLRLFDDDTVEIRNLGVQLVGQKHVGKLKVEAVKLTIRQLHGMDIQPYAERYTADKDAFGYMISAVDHMDARTEIWKAIKANFLKVPLYIDTRAGGRQATILIVDPSDKDLGNQYEKDWIFPQAEGLPERCTEKMTTYVPWSVAGEVGALIVNHLRGETLPYQIHIDTVTHQHVMIPHPFRE